MVSRYHGDRNIRNTKIDILDRIISICAKVDWLLDEYYIPLTVL